MGINQQTVPNKSHQLPMKMNWFFAIIRIAGVSFPGSASMVQLQAELDGHALEERVHNLEDPISLLHEDVPLLSERFYNILTEFDSIKAKLEDHEYQRFSRAIAVLHKKGLIKARHTLGRRLPIDINISDPSYIMYLCERFEDSTKMESLVQRLEKCGIGEWLDGKALSKELHLPRPVVAACFEIYEEKGFGLRSREAGSIAYCGNA